MTHVQLAGRSILVILLMLLLGKMPVALAQRVQINTQVGKVGERVTFTVSLDKPTRAVDALGIILAYDPEKLRYTGAFSKGSLVQDFEFFGVHERKKGQIRVGGFTAKTPIAPGTRGELVSLTFEVLSVESTTIKITRLVDDLAGLTAIPGTFPSGETAAHDRPGSLPADQKASPDNVLARVNGHPITTQDLEYELNRTRHTRKQQTPSSQDKQQALEQLIARELLFQEGERQQLDHADMVIKQRLANLVLQQEVYRKITPDLISEADVQRYFNDHHAEFVQEEVRARQIFIRSASQSDTAGKSAARQKAKALRDKALADPDHFAELAQASSEGPRAPQGGDLGYFTRQRLPKPLGDAAFALKIGEVSEVVETRFGYHILQVIDRREQANVDWRTFEKKIRQTLYAEQTKTMTEALTTRLRRQATITVNTDLLGTKDDTLPPKAVTHPKLKPQRDSRWHAPQGPQGQMAMGGGSVLKLTTSWRYPY